MNKQCVLEAKHLFFSYETKANVICDISLRIYPGERILLLGGNGEGKSTLLYLLAGLYAPESGTIFIEGERVDTSGKQTVQPGFLFQDAEDQILGSTVYEDISFGPMNMKLPEKEIRRRVEKVIDFVGLRGYENHPTHYLSGGQKKRLSLASTLVMNPKILLCDEPFNSLDSEMDEKLEDYLWQYSAQGNTLIISTHDIDFAWRFATRIMLIHEGKIVLDEAPETFFTYEEVLNKYKLKQPTLIAIAKKMGMKKWPKSTEEIHRE